jgi:hypothetical protein
MEDMEGRCWNNMMRGERGGSHIIDFEWTWGNRGDEFTNHDKK